MGKVYIEDFTSRKKSELTEWLKDINKKQADIKMEYIYAYSMIYEKGYIISQSIKDTQVDIGSSLYVYVSLGLH